MNQDKPIAAKIILSLKEKEATGENFIGLFGTLYRAHLVHATPRGLRKSDNRVELTVIFRSRTAFRDWPATEKVQEYWQPKFDDLLLKSPVTIEETNVFIEIDHFENCECETSAFYILQGRSLPLIDELTCGTCLKQISYDKVPISIKIEQWQVYYQRFYMNWLESGIFEQDAYDELTNYKEGKLNIEGEKIRKELSAYFKAPVYMNLFVEEPNEFERCPMCGDEGIDSGLTSPGKICKNCHTIFDYKSIY